MYLHQSKDSYNIQDIYEIHNADIVYRVDSHNAFYEFLYIILSRMKFLKRNNLLKSGLDYSDLYLTVQCDDNNNHTCSATKKFPMIHTTYRFINDVLIRESSRGIEVYDVNMSDNHAILNIWREICTISQSYLYNKSTKTKSRNKVRTSEPPKTTISSIMATSQDLLKTSMPILNTDRIIETVKLDESESEIETGGFEEECNECKEEVIETEIEANIEQLKALKRQLEENLIDVKRSIEIDTDNLANYECNLRFERQQAKKEQEKYEQSVRIYEADINVYRKIKQKIDEGKITEEDVPILFEAKYPIYKFMDAENLLTDENGYTIFTVLYNSCFPPDDDYSIPEEFYDMVGRFIETLPDKVLKTEREIMSDINGMTHNEIFENEEVAMDSDDETGSSRKW